MNDEKTDLPALAYQQLLPDIFGAKIVLGVCGGIAAYKSAHLVRELCALGACVRVVMTASAVSFVSPLTFEALSGQPVACALLDNSQSMLHITLAKWADYVLIAPTSANFLAKMTHGLADDLLSALYLATTVPVLVCPAMNRNMWSHPATAANIAALVARGVILIGPDQGSQACGDVGLGRMALVDDIVATLRLCPIYNRLKGQRVLITAGPTQEAIDPVRYLSNHSSGKMGYALAQAAQVAGAKVSLISGPTALVAPWGVDCTRLTTAAEMLEAVLARLEEGMIAIAAAAVADYCLIDTASQKIARRDNDVLTLTLQKNPDILATIVAQQKAALVVGFAAQTHDVLRYAEEKRLAKQVDIMIANQVGQGLGFHTDSNEVSVLTKKQPIPLGFGPKVILAGQIMAIISDHLQDDGFKDQQ